MKGSGRGTRALMADWGLRFSDSHLAADPQSEIGNPESGWKVKRSRVERTQLDHISEKVCAHVCAGAT